MHTIEKRGALFGSGKALHAVDLFRATAPATHVKTKRRQLLRHAFAQHPGTENANSEVILLMGIERPPLLLLLQQLVFIKTAEIAQDVAQGIFLHLLRHAGIFKAQQRHTCRQGTGVSTLLLQDGIDAGTEGKHAFQPTTVSQHLMGWPPHQRVICRTIIARLPGTNLRLRQAL
ncbi:hypothetical protein D3C71_1716040 [compost metagenome]